MAHPSEGIIRALEDGEEVRGAGEVRAHLARCHDCGHVAADQARALDVLSTALAQLDVVPPLDRARRTVEARVAESRRPSSRFRRNLPRAASFIILVTAGAASALPGSPVREWVTHRWEALTGTGEPGTAPGPAPSTTTQPPSVPPGDDLVGATLPVGPDGLDIHVRGLPMGAFIRVLFVDGDRGGIFAGEGTRFRTQAGQLEASDPPGSVTVEVPTGTSRIGVHVNGTVYLRRTGQGLEILGPVQTRSPTEILFGPTEPGSNAPPGRV